MYYGVQCFYIAKGDPFSKKYHSSTLHFTWRSSSHCQLMQANRENDRVSFMQTFWKPYYIMLRYTGAIQSGLNYTTLLNHCGQSRIEEVAELCHTWRLTIFTPKILVTFFTRHRCHFFLENLMTFFSHRHILIMAFFAHYLLYICTNCSFPLSRTALELTSAYIHVPER